MFDWDGTLYNSVIPTYKSYLVVMDAFGLPQVSLEEFRQDSRPNYHDYYLLLRDTRRRLGNRRCSVDGLLRAT